MVLFKCCTQYAGLEKINFHSNPKERQRQECSNYHTTAFISHANKVMLKILQARLQQNREIPYIQAGFRKGRGTRDQITNIHRIIEKARESQKNIYFCFIDYAKSFDCVDHNQLWKILKEMGIPEDLTCLLRNLYAGPKATVRTGHGTTDWFKIGKGVRQGCVLSPCLFNFYTEFSSVQSLSHVQLFATPWTAACQASLSITNSRSPPKPMSVESVMPSNHLILCHPLLLPSIFPSIRVFSNESALWIRWPKYWSFSFNISPSNEHPGLISFRMDWFDLLAIQGTLKSLLQHHSSKATSCKMPAWMKHKLESRLLAESKEELKSLLMRVKEESEKARLKFSIQKTEIMASSPITSWQIDGRKV